jgi:hypothetical protein
LVFLKDIKKMYTMYLQSRDLQLHSVRESK